MNITDYDFDIPEEQIAQFPSATHGKSRLLLMRKQSTELATDIVENMENHLPRDTLIVANNSKVIPARLYGTTGKGKLLEILLLTPIPCLVVRDMGANWREAEVEILAKPAKKFSVGETLRICDHLRMILREKRDFGKCLVLLQWSGDLYAILDDVGHMPLPPYIRRGDLHADRLRYQTIYASGDKAGSVAAPTAGLHITQSMKDRLLARGHEWREVTLYVGYGTFSPVRCEDIREHRMHEEFIEVPEETAAALRRARQEGRPVLAVGTTTVRALEGAWGACGEIRAYRGATDIYIRPGYSFRVVDFLLTNFHLPRSSLLIMVSALAGRQNILAAYAEAIRLGFRFFSYGDAMLIL